MEILMQFVMLYPGLFHTWLHYDYITIIIEMDKMENVLGLQ